MVLPIWWWSMPYNIVSLSPDRGGVIIKKGRVRVFIFIIFIITLSIIYNNSRSTSSIWSHNNYLISILGYYYYNFIIYFIKSSSSSYLFRLALLLPTTYYFLLLSSFFIIIIIRNIYPIIRTIIWLIAFFSLFSNWSLWYAILFYYTYFVLFPLNTFYSTTQQHNNITQWQ